MIRLLTEGREEEEEEKQESRKERKQKRNQIKISMERTIGVA
jgi:hypothetical protein